MSRRCIALMAALLPVRDARRAKVDAFPASGAVAGWEKSSETRIFAAKDLWQYIDGDAEQYIAAGVVTTSTSDYKYQGQLEATVDVHTMSGADGARKILEAGQTRDARNVQLGDEGVQYAQSVIFRKGHYLVRIVAYESTPDRRRRCWRWRMAWKRNCKPDATWEAGCRTNARKAMKSRRDFLKGAATGAVLIGSKGALGLTGGLDQHAKLKASRRW